MKDYISREYVRRVTPMLKSQLIGENVILDIIIRTTQIRKYEL